MSVLETLMSSPRTALIVPVEGASLCPGSDRWEAFFGGLRGTRLDVFGLYPIVGLMHERDARRAPHHVAAHGTMKDKAAIEEGAVRLRTWLYADGPSYPQIVFLAGGPLAPIWSRAVGGTPVASRVKLVSVGGARGAGAAVMQGLPRLENSITCTRLLHVLGRA